MAVQDVREQFSDLLHRLLVALPWLEHGALRRIEAGRLPYVVVHLDDERAAGRVVRVAVDLHHAVGRLLDGERERVEDLVGAEPHVPAATLLEIRPEGVCVPGPDGVRAVTRHHQVVLGAELVDIGRLGAKGRRDAEVGAPVLQDFQQPAAAHRREAVPAAGDDLVSVMDVDVIPAGELALHRGVDHRIGVLDPAEGLVGEDHSEPESVVWSVALPDRDLVPRVEPFGECGEIEPARAAADDRDAHGHPRLCRQGTYAGCVTTVTRTLFRRRRPMVEVLTGMSLSRLGAVHRGLEAFPVRAAGLCRDADVRPAGQAQRADVRHVRRSQGPADRAAAARRHPSAPAAREGRAFCSGGDVDEIIGATLAMRPDELLAFTRMTGDVVKAMRECPVPIVAAVHGTAAGAGSGFALAADFRVVARSAQFAFLFTKVGLAGADMGAAYLLPRLVGLGRATELLMLGDALPAEDANRHGLVSELVEDDSLDEAAQPWPAVSPTGRRRPTP